jgi:D-3-phosphoglycerate dehydrogenase
MNILINLPEDFFRLPELIPSFERLRAMGTVRCANHNTADEIREDLAWANAVIMWSWPVFTAELLDAAPNLEFAGHIDMRPTAARIELDRGLAVSVSRHGFSPAVAEMALAIILSTLRRISDYHAQMKSGSENWVGSFPTDIDPLERELTGRSVGIIGFGRVGRRLVQLLEPFHCSLRIYDPFVNPDMISANGAIAVGLKEMLRGSDVVILCAASNPGSRHLLGRTEIALFRKDAVFVNVARSALVDTEALVERLQQGDLFAALDVFDKEPLESDSILRSLPNVYLTPHRAGGLIASVHRILDWLIDDLAAHIAGNERTHALTQEMLPGLDG